MLFSCAFSRVHVSEAENRFILHEVCCGHVYRHAPKWHSAAVEVFFLYVVACIKSHLIFSAHVDELRSLEGNIIALSRSLSALRTASSVPNLMA